MSSNVTFTGLASGLNTTALVQNLLRFNQQSISLLQQKVSTDTTQQSSFQGVQTRLQTLQTAASQLGQPQGSVLDNMTVTSSNTNLVTAAVGSGAQAGVTSMKVLSLAQASQIASQGFSDPNSLISQGTFQIQAGSNSATLNIDSSNNTLSGLASAINNAGIGVSATIVNTGGSDPRTQPYRLILTSTNTGTANAIQITNGLAASSGGATQPDFANTETGPAVTSTTFSGTSTVTSNSGPGTYTGSKNDTYTFTVTNGGTVGTDNGIQLSYKNSDGSETGTMTLNSTDANQAKDVVDGLKLTFGTGTLTTGDTLSVNVFSPTVQAAADAQVQLGSGSGAITVRSATNTVTNLIPGVSVKLQSADPTTTVQLNVANDVSGSVTAITNFVNDYNDFASYIDNQTAYIPGSGTTAGTSGPLNGNTSVIGLRSQVEQAITAIAPNLPSQINRLGAIGISPGANGQLSIDTTQLTNVLNGSVSGIQYSNLKTLFGLQGQSSSPNVQFATASSATLPSSTPYTVHITQAAQQASITGTNPVSTSTVIDGTNNTLVLSVDGKTSGTITLASGTYTAQGLASELQTEINAAVAPNGSTVAVADNNGSLQITSGRYGSASTVSVTSGSALTALGYSGTESSTGVDVAGSYVANGVTETATGVGQILTGASTNTNTSGLSVVVTLTPTQIASGGTDSTMTVTRGIAASLSNTLTGMLDPVSGQMTLIANQFTQQIQNAQKDVNTQTAAMNAQQAALMTQFAALESVMANLQSESNLLSSFASSTLGTTTSSAIPNLSNLSAGSTTG